MTLKSFKPIKKGNITNQMGINQNNKTKQKVVRHRNQNLRWMNTHHKHNQANLQYEPTIRQGKRVVC